MSLYDDKKAKRFEVLDKHNEFATSHMTICCPFCSSEFTAFIWSLAGAGKKCPTCGAIHYFSGNAHPVKKGYSRHGD